MKPTHEERPEPVPGDGRAGAAGGARERPLLVSPEHLYKAIGLFFLLFFLLRHFDAIKQTLLLVYAAAILAVALNPLARLVPAARKWVAGLVGLVVISLLGLLLWLGIPALASQIRGLGERAPEFEERLLAWGESIREATGLNVQLLGEQTADAIRNMFAGLGTEAIFGGARGFLEFLVVPFLVLIGGLYALANPNERLLLPLLRVVPRERRPAFFRMLQLLGERILGWIRGTLLAMLAVGLLSAAALWLIGVPYWLLLGIFMGLTEFIPIVGPWIGGIPAVVLAFLSDPMTGVWTAVAIILIQQLESNVITPWAMSRAAHLHPMITLFALVLFGSMFGFLGILLAVPLALLVWTVVQVLWVEQAIDSDDDTIPPVVQDA
jgi:predicted PurR-regulated permease PerM